MNYVKINDETEYIYGMAQRLFRPSPYSGLIRDKAKENELYSLKTDFHKKYPNGNGWKIMLKIPMFNSRTQMRYMLYGFKQNQKSALVAAKYQTLETLTFSLPETPFFCYQEYLSRAQYIIFSDNPILAENIHKQFDSDVLWEATSFLQKQDLKDLDFSIFSGKTIVYYLVEHSGNDWRNTCFNAIDIIDRFTQDTNVYIMTYPEKDVPSLVRYPVFLSSKQDLEEEVEQLKALPSTIPTINWEVPKSPKRQKIAEGVLDKTLTLVYDSSAALRTKCLTHWAAAISQGKTNLQAHLEFEPRKTAYIHVNDIDDGFTSGLQKGFEDMFKKELSIPSYPKDPSSISDAEYILTLPDLFLSYPVPTDPFFKFYLNFYYTSFWPRKTLENDETYVAMQLLDRCIDNLKQHYSETEIIILDIPSLWELGIPMTFLTRFFYYLRSQYAVILTTDSPSAKQHEQIRNLPFDKIVRIQRKSDTPEAINIDLIIERDDVEHKKHTVRLTKGPKDSQWRHRPPQRLSVEEKIKYIKQHKGMEIKEVAIALGVSISYVKKLRGLAGVSKKVPNRAPKYPKRKAVDYSVNKNS